MTLDTTKLNQEINSHQTTEIEWLNAYDSEIVFSQKGSLELHIDQSKPIVVVDFDGTMHHYFDAIMLHQKCPPIETQEFEHYYHFHDMIGHELLHEIANDVCALDRMLEVGIYPGTLEAMDELSKVANIIVMTHRQSHHGPMISKTLAHFKIPHMCLLAGRVDKIEFCKRYNVSLLIDDKPTTIEKAKEHGVNVATIIQPYNRTMVTENNIPADEHWPELIVRVKKLLSEIV